MEGAHNALLDLEELEEDDLDRIRTDYQKLAELARSELRGRKYTTGVPDVDTYPREKKVRRKK